MASNVSRSTLSPEPHLLTPEDAYHSSPPRSQAQQRSAAGQLRSSSTTALSSLTSAGSSTTNGAGGVARARYSRSGTGDEQRSRSRRRQRTGGEHSSATGGKWKKLLWIKQPYPDNYTDPSTFLLHLQRNPRLQAYDFWPLVADSMVIVQHVCTVALFVCCFVAIYQERISPVSVVGTGTACSVVGWIMWDIWLGRDEWEKEKKKERERNLAAATIGAAGNIGSSNKVTGSGIGKSGVPGSVDGVDGDAAANGSVSGAASPVGGIVSPGLGISTPASMASGSALASKIHSRNQSSTSLAMYNGISPTASSLPNSAPSISSPSQPPYQPPNSILSPRNQQRLATAKSALLIYMALLGLSPILKSLTISTTSDSIWAMSCWLLLTNIFTFDYGGSSPSSSTTSSPSPSTRFPASLSTNAALMASTVLASRLPTTTHVFSLTLFSIEVFGLFPVFRRHLRQRSFALHVLLTVLLILGSGAGLGVTLIGNGSASQDVEGGPSSGGGASKMAAAIGALVWGLGSVVAMGGCSWWLIGLQRYKNVVIGPWDPARPIIRAGAWD